MGQRRLDQALLFAGEWEEDVGRFREGFGWREGFPCQGVCIQVPKRYFIKKALLHLMKQGDLALKQELNSIFAPSNLQYKAKLESGDSTY